MIEIDNLLNPISDDSPCGTYLKLDRTAYRSLRNAYNNSQSAFRKLVETPDASSDQDILETNDNAWKELRNVTENALSNDTKDLELIGWYISSQLFTPEPFLHLAQSTTVLKTWVEIFWESLNPFQPENKLKATDEVGIAKERAEFRTRPLLQLVGETNDSTAIYQSILMLGFIGDITYTDFLKSEKEGTLTELKSRALSSFDGDTENNLMNLAQAYVALDDTEKLIAEQCHKIGAQVISFKHIKSNISDLINAIQYLVPERFEPWPFDDTYREIKEEEPVATIEHLTQNDSADDLDSNTTEALPSSPTATTPRTQQVVVAKAGDIVHRDQAFQELRKIAEYFKETEPHSPVPFLLERAIRWGYLSLPELLQEMIGAESQAIDHINLLSGMDNLSSKDISNKKTFTIATPRVKQPEQPVVKEESHDSTPIKVESEDESGVPTQPKEATPEDQKKNTKDSDDSPISDFSF
ncbi:type VI secretion system ImpA family N-terminal domain-containing protein [Vibrio sp.]|nr:type VI secretion system ImpA family N-terminal domain-containing protein [Vibrio sp.]